MKKNVFILLFAASLTLPTLCFLAVRNHIDTSNYENRVLASRPRLSPAGLGEFPAQFEAYYNDHVPFKNQMVRVKNKLDTKVFRVSTAASVTVGKDGWLFYTATEEGGDALGDYQHTNLYTADQMDALADQFRRVTEGMKERGIRFTIFIAPNKESIYGKYMPDSVRIYGEESRLERVVPFLRDRGLPVFSVAEALQSQADRFQLYYHCDTHWNQAGAFLGSQEIARELTGSFWSLDDVEVVYTEAGWPGDLARILGMAQESVEDTECYIMGYLPEITEECIYSSEDGNFGVYTSNSENHRTLLVIGDSFSQYLKFFLPKLYEKSIFTTFDTYTPDVLGEYDIDDVLYIAVERNQKYFEHVEDVLEGREWDVEQESGSGS